MPKIKLSRVYKKNIFICPCFSILNPSAENVLKVVNPPQNPTVKAVLKVVFRFAFFMLKPNIRPKIKHPEIFTRNVESGKNPKFRNLPVRYLKTLPKPPPIKTAKQFNILKTPKKSGYIM